MSLSEHSCKICSSEVTDTDSAVLCELCEKWIHNDCASTGKTINFQKELWKPQRNSLVIEFFFFSFKNKDFHILLNDSSHNNNPKPYPKIEQGDKKIPKKVLRNESSI